MSSKPSEIDCSDLNAEDLASLPEATRKQLAWVKTSRRLITSLESRRTNLQQRLNAYLMLAANRRKGHTVTPGIPTLTELGELTGLDRTTISKMRTASRVGPEAYSTLLFLAGIYPPPLPKQSSGEARASRLIAALKWNAKPEKSGTLMDHLHRQMDKALSAR